MDGSVALKLLREVCRSLHGFLVALYGWNGRNRTFDGRVKVCCLSHLTTFQEIWRKQKDSNLRQVEPVPALKAGAIDLSAMLPMEPKTGLEPASA